MIYSVYLVFVSIDGKAEQVWRVCRNATVADAVIEDIKNFFSRTNFMVECRKESFIVQLQIRSSQ